VFSQPVLLALVASGMARDDAYRIVQRNALRTWEEGTDFRGLLDADADVVVGAGVLDEAFDLARSVRNVDRVFAALAAASAELSAERA
jgi:adenylosuccinate lyase